MKSTMMLLMGLTTMTLAACGGDGGGGNKKLSAFVGVWLPTAGTSTTTCGAQSGSSQVTDTVTWTAGASSDLVSTLADSCVLRANVTGSTASLAPPATCTFNGVDDDGYAYTETMTLTGYTFALAADGLTASESESATMTFAVAGETVNCGFTQTASYQKQ